MFYFSIWETDLNDYLLISLLSDVVVESDIINEYIDEAWPEKGIQLLPPLNEPLKRSKARLWMDFVGKKCTPPFMQMLLKQDESGQSEAEEALLHGLTTFAADMDPVGPFFLGPELRLRFKRLIHKLPRSRAARF